MTNKILHTFAVLAYKESPYLEVCLKSLLTQNSKSEIIIFTSTPNTFIFDISKKYKIKIFINENINNIASDWSFAYNNVETKYVTLAHQDDIYFPNYTNTLINLAESYADSLITFSNYSELYGNKLVTKNLNLIIKRIMLNLFFLGRKSMHRKYHKKFSLLFGTPICCPSVMFNKQNINYFCFNSEFKVSLDWEAWLQLTKKSGSFTFNNSNLVVHRIHDQSETSIAISKNIRYNEDRILFQLLWGKVFGFILNKLYSISTKYQIN